MCFREVTGSITECPSVFHSLHSRPSVHHLACFNSNVQNGVVMEECNSIASAGLVWQLANIHLYLTTLQVFIGYLPPSPASTVPPLPHQLPQSCQSPPSAVPQITAQAADGWHMTMTPACSPLLEVSMCCYKWSALILSANGLRLCLDPGPCQK